MTFSLNALQTPTPPALPKSPESSLYWLPSPSSVTTASVDDLYYFLLWLSAVSTAVIFGAMIYFCIRYRARSRAANQQPEGSIDHNTTLEIIWSVLPLVILIGVFVWGFKGYVNLRTPPKGAMEVHVTAQKWKWLFKYPDADGYTDDTLHVPVNTPVRILINSTDVLHSLFIPSFRVKMDAVPGRFTELWFEATESGEFPIFCAEYCGTSHSDMISRVVVHPPGGYDTFLEKAEKLFKAKPPVERGAILYARQGCSTCHSIDGTRKIGPSWKGLFGSQRALTTGDSVTADENYIRESILNPQGQVVSGYTPSMPTFQGKLKDYELEGLIAFIKAQK